MPSSHGRNSPNRKHLRDHDFNFQSHSHFQLSANAELFIATLFRYRDAEKFKLHGFAVMPNHVHILITPSVDHNTSRCVQLIKGGYSFPAREQSPKEIWHSGHHEHRIRDGADHQAQLAYIANNPTRKNLQAYPYVHTAESYRERIDL
jgi:putative transposase